ncbi:MAG: hypothetical protein AAF798_19910, partial [Bacteroidota bacterium]
EALPIHYTLYLINENEVVITNSHEKTRKSFPLDTYKDSWSADEVISIEEKMNGDFEDFKGLKCLKIEEKKSFPNFIFREKNTRIVHHLVCSKRDFIKKVNYPNIIPYLPIARKKIGGRYSEYEIILASYILEYNEEAHRIDKYSIFELQRIEEVILPMNIIEQVLLKPLLSAKD